MAHFRWWLGFHLMATMVWTMNYQLHMRKWLIRSHTALALCMPDFLKWRQWTALTLCMPDSLKWRQCVDSASWEEQFLVYFPCGLVGTVASEGSSVFMPSPVFWHQCQRQQQRQLTPVWAVVLRMAIRNVISRCKLEIFEFESFCR
jgi:hypothetical protein